MKQNYEHWCEMEEAGGYYEISDWGRVRNKNYRPHMQRIRKLCDDKKHKCICFRSTRNGVKYSVSVAHLVYKYFGIGKTIEGVRELVHHKDGDYRNNRIDNLYIRTYDGEVAEGWQLDIFNAYALVEIKKVVKRNYSHNMPVGFDEDELVQTALILCYKYLSKLAPNEPFYSFCMRYVKMAYWKQIPEFKRKANEVRRF